MNDVFAAAAINAVKPEPKKAKAAKPGVESGPALAKVCAIDFIMDSLGGIRKTYEGQVKDEMTDRFLDLGSKSGKQPDNYDGISGKGTANCQMKKRSSRSVLTEDEVKLLTESEISMTEITVVEEAYIFNPEILKNPELRAQITAAFAKIDFGGQQPILYQPAKKDWATTENSLDEIFAKVKDSKLLRKLVSTIASFALKTKWTGDKAEAYALIAEDVTPKSEQK